MLVIIDEREIVTSGYTCRFGSEGVSSAGFCPLEFQEWVAAVADADLVAVEAFLLGDCRDRRLYPKMIKDRTRAPVIAMNETPCLEQTLDLFAAGVDDVVRKPFHVREILARVGQSGAATSTSATVLWLANCGSFLMAGILNSREFLCHCRGASAESLNIWSITGAGASARPKSSIPSMEFSMRMSKKTWLKAISASYARNCAASSVTTPSIRFAILAIVWTNLLAEPTPMARAKLTCRCR